MPSAPIGFVGVAPMCFQLFPKVLCLIFFVSPFSSTILAIKQLTRSNYIFLCIKTFHELGETFHSLLDENGDRKSFERFLNDVQTIDNTYNRNYLRAEYNFVKASAEMATK